MPVVPRRDFGFAFPRVSLMTRLTAFSLAALAMVLAGFSTAAYLAAQASLTREAAERLDLAVDALVAAVKFGDVGLEWVPKQRLRSLAHDDEVNETRWIVHDGNGHLVDHSPNLTASSPLATLPRLDRPGSRIERRLKLHNLDWRVVQLRFDASPSVTSLPEGHYNALVLTSGLSLRTIDDTLHHLGRVLAALSLVVWLLAAALARGLSRRALAPLTGMAQTARKMGAGKLDLRLPNPGTGDELQELADAFNGLLDRLHEAFQRQARFTGDASHQLRTPLAVMLGQIDVTLRRERPTEDYKQILNGVRNQAVHLGQIVEALLFLARADAEAQLPDRQVIDLDFWVRQRLNAWSNHPRASDLSLVRLDRRDGPLPTRAHPPLLGQLLDNLLDNACKYSTPGTPILVGLAREQSEGSSDVVALSVRDAGTGIPAEDLSHIFDPFFRSARARAEGRPGVGLGLTVAQRIAASLGAHLGAESGPEPGSVFTLRLPLERQPEDDRILVTLGQDSAGGALDR